MSEDLPELSLVAGDYGWSSPLPANAPRFFGTEVFVEIHTRLVPYDPKELPTISRSQAQLVRQILANISPVLKQAEDALATYNRQYDPTFVTSIRYPHIWLSSEDDDGVSWTFVVGRIEDPDYGYHIEFRGTDISDIWGGD